MDLHPAVRLGSFTVSHYLVDKYYTRFADGIRQSAHRAPTPAESKAWLELFFAQQVLIAHANQLGYAQRPEVARSVDRMARHMLSQPGPSIYRNGAQKPPPSPDDVAILYRQSREIRDVIIAHFDHAADAAAAFGEDSPSNSVSEQTRRVFLARDHGAARLFDGPASWPFPPFLEIASAVMHAPIGRWTLQHEPPLGTYLFLVRQAIPPGVPPGEPDAGFIELVRQVRIQVAQLREMKARLAEAALSIEAQAVEQGAQLWQALPPNAAELPPFSNENLKARILARYQSAGNPETITLELFRRSFNERLVRHVPRTPAEVQQCVEEMVSAELTLRAARDEGIDQLPQFIEDRQGFAGFQVLEAFETQVLLPGIAITDQEVERYYRMHPDEFRRVTRIRGQWVEFTTADAASRWMQGDSAVTPLTDRQIELTPEAPVLGMERMHSFFFASPVGTKTGPFPRGSFFCVFTKQADLASGPAPLAEAENAIRHRLTRNALEKSELLLAAKLATQFKIDEQIDRARYGLAPGDLHLPWQ